MKELNPTTEQKEIKVLTLLKFLHEYQDAITSKELRQLQEYKDAVYNKNVLTLIVKSGIVKKIGPSVKCSYKYSSDILPTVEMARKIIKSVSQYKTAMNAKSREKYHSKQKPINHKYHSRETPKNNDLEFDFSSVKEIRVFTYNDFLMSVMEAKVKYLELNPNSEITINIDLKSKIIL